MPSGSRLHGAFSQHIAGALRAAAARRKVSQTALAEATGISQPQISKFLAGKTAPNLDEWAAMCQALGRSYMEVMAEAEREMVKEMKDLTPEQRQGLLDGIERNRPKPGDSESKREAG